MFFEQVKNLAGWAKPTSDEHFSVDGTLIDPWASHKSFVCKGCGELPHDGTRNPTQESKTTPEARLARKSQGDTSRL